MRSKVNRVKSRQPYDTSSLDTFKISLSYVLNTESPLSWAQLPSSLFSHHLLHSNEKLFYYMRRKWRMWQTGIGCCNVITALDITQPENTETLKHWPTASGMTYDMYCIGSDPLLYRKWSITVFVVSGLGLTLSVHDTTTVRVSWTRGHGLPWSISIS